MASLEYFLVAESISIDQSTNRASIFNVLEDIQVTGLPAMVPQMVAIAAWNLDSAEIGKEFQAMLCIEAPGQPPQRHPLNFVGRHRRHRVMTRFEGFLLGSEGDLRFEILLNGVHGATHTVTVTRHEPMAGGGLP